MARTASGGSRNRQRRGFLFAQGWPDDRAPGPVGPARPYLTASEIGSFAFCRQAWYLDRCGVAVDARAQRRRAQGVLAHRGIGRQVDHVRTLDGARRVALALLAGLVVALLLVLVRGST
jgi:hypothetical protein